jgi:hypothetical protein
VGGEEDKCKHITNSGDKSSTLLRGKKLTKCDFRDITQGLTLGMLKKKGFKLRILWCECVLGFDEIRIHFKMSSI